MTDKKPASREEALQYLVERFDEWPQVWHSTLPAPNGWGWCESQNGNICLVPIARANEITRADWLAAQSKSEAPVWKGEGLPPVGLKCICTPHNSIWGFPTVSDYIGHVLAYDYDYFWWHDGAETRITSRTDKVDFSPIKTDADRRRDDAMQKLSGMMKKVGTWDEIADRIIDAIDCGEIPGIVLEGKEHETRG